MESRLEPRQPGEAAMAAPVRQEGALTRGVCWHVILCASSPSRIRCSCGLKFQKICFPTVF